MRSLQSKNCVIQGRGEVRSVEVRLRGEVDGGSNPGMRRRRTRKYLGPIITHFYIASIAENFINNGKYIVIYVIFALYANILPLIHKNCLRSASVMLEKALEKSNAVGHIIGSASLPNTMHA